jgi:dipeptidyl aminopeptidase/acylaminoacyl peptidase
MKRALMTLLAAASLTALAQAPADKPTIESLFRLPQYAAMAISPDGEHIAALAPVGKRQNLVVMNVEKRSAVPVTNFSDRDVVQFRWLNSKRLLASTGTLATRDFDAKGGGLYAVDRDGRYGRLIGEGGSEDEKLAGGARMVLRPIEVIRTLPGETDDFIAREYAVDAKKAVPGALLRVDSRSGRRSTLSGGKPESALGESWVVDRHGVARAFTASSGSKARIYYRKDGDSAWEKLDEFSSMAADQWDPVAIDEDGRTLLVTSWKGGRDKGAIVRYDPQTRSFGDVVAAHPQVDLRDVLRTRDDRALGVRYEADKGGVAWFDETLAAVQSAVDKAFPGNVNLLSYSSDRQRFVITSISDVSPGAFYYFDRKAGKIQWLADRMPWIDAKKMSPVTPLRYTARDGMEIPGYLTLPRGSSGKNLPLVVMVHGGPWVDGDHWYFNPEVQFLASRGYAVLQPNFRGTTRYGWKHFASSFKQWGLTMQDDITDGVRWAIGEGVADPQRVCIYGASYGGYAAMMGLVKEPALFKCGINYVGVTDLELFLNATWSDFANSDFLDYEMKDMFGDASRDRERLRATSPALHAERIQAPVLMAYGSSDVRVVPEHGTRMKAALDRAGKKVEWMMVEGEGHGFREMKNQELFYGAMERFLERNLGAAKSLQK